MAGIIHLFFGTVMVIRFGIIVSGFVIYAVHRGNGFPFYEALARPSDAPHRSKFVVIPLITTALGGLLSVILFPAYAHFGFWVTGLGDAVGEPVGAAWGKNKYRVPSLFGVPATRSVEGSLAVILVSFLVFFSGLLFLEISLPKALIVSAICGSIIGLVEAVSNHGTDNLTIQVFASGMVYLFLEVF